jgi:hypothetical protein
MMLTLALVQFDSTNGLEIGKQESILIQIHILTSLVSSPLL